MGITVGAALKKAAIAILGNPKTLKKLLFAVLVVCVALLLPMVACSAAAFRWTAGNCCGMWRPT